MEAQAAHCKTRVDRNQCCLVGLERCAELMEQPYRDVEHVVAHRFDYMQPVAIHKGIVCVLLMKTP